MTLTPVSTKDILRPLRFWADVECQPIASESLQYGLVFVLGGDLLPAGNGRSDIRLVPRFGQWHGVDSVRERHQKI